MPISWITVTKANIGMNSFCRAIFTVASSIVPIFVDGVPSLKMLVA